MRASIRAMGVLVTKLVLFFDRARGHRGDREASNAEQLLRLLAEGNEQLCWYHPGAPRRRFGPLRWREAAADDARAAIAEAYQFLVDQWASGDHIFMFGVGRGAYCAQALTRLLDTVGVLPDLMDYVLSAYALPRTQRTAQDWERVTEVMAQLSEQREIGVPVWYLGLWDTLGVPGSAHRSMPEPMANVVLGRHAVAVDGFRGSRLVASACERIEEVWFGGAHCDVVGGPGACRPLADITFDWMLDGALRAGLEVSSSPELWYAAPAPNTFDALAASAPFGMRRLPADALVHASLDVYLRAHPQYWRRLPDRVTWADPDWLARGERLLPVEEAVPPVQPAKLVALAS